MVCEVFMVLQLGNGIANELSSSYVLKHMHTALANWLGMETMLE